MRKIVFHAFLSYSAKTKRDGQTDGRTDRRTGGVAISPVPGPMKCEENMKF